MITQVEYLKLLKRDLSHLYELSDLRGSRLIELLGISTDPDPPASLHNILVKAIDDLKPADDSPYTHAWEVYESLFYRFVEQLSPQEVADQLAISPRHLRRKQQEALLFLASLLWKQYGLGGEPGNEFEPVLISDLSRVRNSWMEKELAWLKDSSRESSVNIYEILPLVEKLAQKLAIRHSVHLTLTIPEGVPSLLIHPTALRQILLSLLSVVISRAQGGEVSIQVRVLRRDVQIRLQGSKLPVILKPLPESDLLNIKTAQRLAELTRCRLAISCDGMASEASLTVPTREQLNVLVIDDNTDTLQMFKRYTAGSRYHLLTTRDAAEAFLLCEKYSPEIIVLDVMMPQVDGWQVLEQLRQNPITANTRILLCSILGQSEFAVFMGADAMISKPVTPQAFLKALDQQAALMEKGSH
jgi:CheY-like chemotaxis protein